MASALVRQVPLCTTNSDICLQHLLKCHALIYFRFAGQSVGRLGHPICCVTLDVDHVLLQDSLTGAKVRGSSALGQALQLRKMGVDINLSALTLFCMSFPQALGLASLVAQVVKNLHAMQETWVQSPDWEDLLEKRMGAQLQCSCLENSMD